VVLWRLRDKLSRRDLPEMFLIRGIVFSHEAVRDWRPSSRLHWLNVLRRRRRGAAADQIIKTSAWPQVRQFTDCHQ
jgi:putative transposase